MKWTQHQRLEIYGVHLVGWPNDIPLQNPSALKAHQNKKLLELLNNGTLKFIKTIPPQPTQPPTPPLVIREVDPFQWALRENYGEAE